MTDKLIKEKIKAAEEKFKTLADEMNAIREQMTAAKKVMSAKREEQISLQGEYRVLMELDGKDEKTKKEDKKKS